jgi:hypothetical protein
MLDRLRQDLLNQSYETNNPVNGEPALVVDVPDIDSIIKKHDYLTLQGLLSAVAPYQLVAVKAGTTICEYDFLGTAGLALGGGIEDAFKNISGRPMEMNVAKVDVRTGYNVYNDADGNKVDNPILYVYVN